MLVLKDRLRVSNPFSALCVPAGFSLRKFLTYPGCYCETPMPAYAPIKCFLFYNFINVSVKSSLSDEYIIYFCTFTCYRWLPLFSLTNSYDIVYNWFNILKQDSIDILAFVVMPNHLHFILNFPQGNYSVNKIIGNGKRFMAYEIVNRLKNSGDVETLQLLSSGITLRDKRKGQLHRVFKDSFDAKPLYSFKFLIQKINYIHYNPVSGKWNLAPNFIGYEHSSASFYEEGISKHFIPRHYLDVWKG